MLVFTMRIIITDIQKSFRGFWIIVYFALLGFITLTPFLDQDLLILFYVTVIIFSAMVPRITKIFYALPLGNKLLRRYLHLRSVLLASLFLVMGGIMTLLSLIWPVPSVEKGWLRIMSFIVICIIMSLSNRGETTIKSNKRNTIILGLVIVLVVGNVINSIFLINFRIQLIISLISIIVAEVVLIVGLRGVKLVNYVEPVYYAFPTKAWRNQLRMQVADSEDKKPGQGTE